MDYRASGAHVAGRVASSPGRPCPGGGRGTFGTLYLNLAGRLPQDAAGGFRPVSAHAAAVTCAVLAVGAVAGCILTVLRARGTR